MSKIMACIRILKSWIPAKIEKKFIEYDGTNAKKNHE